MRPTVEAKIAEIADAGEVRFRDETLVLEGLGGREIGCETLYTAISPGTELAAYQGLTPLRPDRTHSRVVGYCNLGRVIATGEWVRRFRPGDLVLTLQSHRSHFVCGEDEVLVRYEAEEGAGLDEQALIRASTTYLFHQGYSALLRGDLKPGQYVAVVGLGTLGLATVAVGAHFGARMLAFSDQDRSRATGLELGARRCWDKSGSDAVADEVGELTRSTGVDLVVVTSSRWEDFRLATEIARPGGKLCVLGFPGRKDPIPPFNPLDPALFYRKQLSYIACGYTPDVKIDPRDLRFTIGRNCAYLLDLVLERELPAERLISTVQPWHRIGDVYERIAARDPGFFTAVLQWAGAEEPGGADTGSGVERESGDDAIGVEQEMPDV